MYKFKTDLDIKINKTFASEIIGVSREHLTQILNGKNLCTKYLAFAITKYLDEDAEIEDFFERTR